MVRTLIVGSLLCVTWNLQASPIEFQQEETSTASRIEQIESAPTEKEANLQPEAEATLQHAIKWVQNSFPYRLMNSEVHGFGFGFGMGHTAAGTGSGFAIGPEFARTDLLNRKLDLKIRARGSKT